MRKLLVTGALALSLILPSYSLSSSKEDTKQKQQLETLIIKDGMYDDHNAFVDESKYSLEKILESVELIGCEVGYTMTYTDKGGKIVKEYRISRVIGTGTVIEKKNGKAYILTNDHVTKIGFLDEMTDGVVITENYREVYVIKKGLITPRFVKATPVASDSKLDISLLEVEDSEDFVKFPYKIGNSDDLRPGDFVWIAGNPHGLVDYVLKGNVSKVSYPYDNRLFMIGCAVEPGYSGGAVIAIRDGEYELVGVVVATLVRQNETEETYAMTGYGIAIKINDAMKIVNTYFDSLKNKK
ncbi:hypothetical protein FJZ53_06300 [Candidatus Woesearchaeota archaeon]|nr:hypothetical protein [Candidatus Woesearchaeota archaeon]